MGLFTPTPPPYDALEWSKEPFTTRARMVCESWALQGYGTPPAVFLLYALKVVAYVGIWGLFVARTEGLGEWATFSQWWAEPIALQKAIVWSLLFEILGLGCGSGPLTGRYLPPVGGFLYFLRPGTTKQPLFGKLPIFAGTQRNLLDVLLYALLIIACLHALWAPQLGLRELLPIAVLVPLLGIMDKTLFLAARAEHYWVVIVVLCASAYGQADWRPGVKAVHAALWFWAGVSKLNHHFPSVVCVMSSNSPVYRLPALRRLLYKNYPKDLGPSRLAVWAAHFGTALELSIPVLLLLGDGGALTLVGLCLMLGLHIFITSAVPMGVPIEWNVIVVYAAFVLFGQHAEVSVLSIHSPALFAFVLLFTVLLPLLGNLKPAWVSFLLSMRYYAGNWACSVWLFEGQAHTKLEQLTKSSPWLHDQLARFYDERTIVGLVGKAFAFRLMHLHGRAFGALVPKAVDDFQRYQWVDGELIAGLALGWNFGDAHLHSEGLVQALQAQCGWKPGELRCIFLESQPLGGCDLAYRIYDAHSGELDRGRVSVNELRSHQPWDFAWTLQEQDRSET